MAINEELLKILVCPVCKGPLEYEPDVSLTCRTDGLKFPIRDEIPIMLVEEAEKLA